MSCFWKHQWGKWRETGRGEILRNDETKVGRYILMERECEMCGFQEITSSKNFT